MLKVGVFKTCGSLNYFETIKITLNSNEDPQHHNTIQHLRPSAREKFDLVTTYQQSQHQHRRSPQQNIHGN